MQDPIDVAVAQIKLDEGFRAKPYLDSVGKSTFGYGCTSITEPEAAVLLSNRVNDLLHSFKQMDWWPMLNDARMAVILNLGYNVGVGGVLGFHDMIAAIRARDYKAAAAALLASKYATQVGERALRLAAVMEIGA